MVKRIKYSVHFFLTWLKTVDSQGSQIYLLLVEMDNKESFSNSEIVHLLL